MIFEGIAAGGGIGVLRTNRQKPLNFSCLLYAQRIQLSDCPVDGIVQHIAMKPVVEDFLDEHFEPL